MQKSCRAIMKMDNSRSPHSVLKLRIPFGNCIDKICFVLYIMLSKLHLFLNTVWHNLEVLSPESTPKLCQSNIVQNLFLKIMNISHVQKHTICVNGHQKIEILPKSHPKWPKTAKSVLSKIILDWMLLSKKSYFFFPFECQKCLFSEWDSYEEITVPPGFSRKKLQLLYSSIQLGINTVYYV